MGIIRQFTMPLLSTLAALVIIVHSAEEDNQFEYGRDLRPSIVDTGIHSYEQPWRVVDSELVMKKITQTDTWNNNSTEESQKHRRTRRKRKRRPQITIKDSLSPQETINYPEKHLQPNFEVDLSSKEHLADTPKRRRKKLESQSAQWTDVSLQRPLRRRGQRRKRPSHKIWSESEELNGYRSEKNNPTTTATSKKNDILDLKQNDDSTQYIPITGMINDSELLEDLIAKEAENSEKKEPKDEFRLLTNEKDSHIMKHHDPYLQEDKSLSEVSLEVTHRTEDLKDNYENENLRAKLKDKSTQVYNEQDKVEFDGSVDPITLKEILRRSNGTSLSEILQLHNLSLTDLLNGKENALSILKSEGSHENRQNVTFNIVNDVPLIEVTTDNNKQPVKNDLEENVLLHLETKYVTFPETKYSTTTQSSHRSEKEEKDKKENIQTTPKQENNVDKIISIRRYPLGAHRKLHMRPMINSTHKSQLSRDLVALNARKFYNQRRNVSKSIEWRNVIPSIINISTAASDMNKQIEISTVRIPTDRNQTTPIDVNNQNKSLLFKNENNKRFDIEVGTDAIFSTTPIKPITTSENPVLFNETQYSTSTIKPLLLPPGLQRHNFNIRMKKKRRRQKNTTTELPLNKVVIYSSEKENLPLSTDIIVRTQEPKPRLDEEFVTLLEDFMTTEIPINSEITLKSVKPTAISSTAATLSTTTHKINEKTASTDIDEIFKDTQISARLSKILLERNMTLRELVEHRERGSSHIHLADIFHNASKEPNPPEPFLSKSAIEPISKEIYPLRAILEANAHDPTIKPAINDPNILKVNYIHIPIVMDFGNNVNENAENMGIMSLFNNFTEIVKHNNTFDKDFKAKSHETDIIATNTTHKKAIPTIRQNRILTDYNNENDVVSWNEIFSLMRRNYKNETKDLFESIRDETSVPEIPTEAKTEDADDDSLSFLEDLQHHKIFDSNIYPDSNDRLDKDPLEKADAATGILEKIPSQTKSITAATASIAGLAMVLFLLVYAVFKWKQHKDISNKELSFCNERIPTPVFENRKAQRNNSSTRSISPMLSTSNIYTLNTLDSRNGKDSPEYMWDTLRKPFQ